MALTEGKCYSLYPVIDMFTNNSQTVKTLIAEYCDSCPVALECLELGASLGRDTIGSIWGGVKMVGENKRRLEAIGRRRSELMERGLAGVR